MRNLFLISFLFFVISISFAQNAVPEGYQKAQNALGSKDYWTAINGFKEFTNQDKYGNLANYAAFHGAEAALAANQPVQARDFLKSIYSIRWKYQDESKYLLALAYFQNSQLVEALRVIETIQNEQVKTKGYNASFSFLVNESPNFFVTHLVEFKTNQGFTAALSEVFKKKTILSSSEQSILREIQVQTPRKLSQDETLDLSLILPFTSGSNSIRAISNIDFNVELYQGMQLAVNELKSQGQKVNLTAYDSKRDLATLTGLLKNQEILESDILIGPIYPDESDLVSSFAETQKIPFVHPLSNLGERFEETEYSYLYRPSVASLAKGITEALRKQNWGRSVAIGYSGSSRDERLAQLVAQELSQAGLQVTKSQQIDARTVTDFLRSIGIRQGRSASVSQVILLTDDPAIAQPTFALMESITASVPVLVMDSWLGFNFANYEMLEFPNFYFISNNTPKFSAPEMETFRQAFYKKHLNYPSLNAVLGYELIYWLHANAKSTQGFDLRSGLDLGAFREGKVTWGFNFRNSNNNTYVPVFKLEMGELIPLN